MQPESGACSPYLVGTLIGLLSMATFYFYNKPLSVSTVYARLAATGSNGRIADNAYQMNSESRQTSSSDWKLLDQLKRQQHRTSTQFQKADHEKLVGAFFQLCGFAAAQRGIRKGCADCEQQRVNGQESVQQRSHLSDMQYFDQRDNRQAHPDQLGRGGQYVPGQIVIV
jgi:hypothetical protein